MVLIGILLVSPVIVLLTVEGFGYRRGGYDGAFWKLPLDEKLDHVADHRWELWWVSAWGLFGMFLMTGGVAGLTHLLAEADEPVLAFVAFGGYLVALFAWVFGLIVQAAAMTAGAIQRAETRVTPTWIHPLWDAGHLAEGAWIIGTNLAYAVFGLAIIQSGLVDAWAGWVALGLGLLIPIGVLVTRAGFPQLGVLGPLVIGIAVIVESI